MKISNSDSIYRLSIKIFFLLKLTSKQQLSRCLNQKKVICNGSSLNFIQVYILIFHSNTIHLSLFVSISNQGYKMSIESFIQYSVVVEYVTFQHTAQFLSINC